MKTRSELISIFPHSISPHPHLLPQGEKGQEWESEVPRLVQVRDRFRIAPTFAVLMLLTAYHLPLTTSVCAEEIPVSKEMAAAVRPISAQEEIAIGREVAANVAAQFGVLQNDSLTEYVNLVGLTLAQFSPRQDVPYRFAILDSNIVNAFAAPGGYIFISKGLLTLLKDEAQLAGILGHEIAHVVQRHVIKEIQKSKIAQAAIPGYVKATAQKAEWMSQIADQAIQMIWRGLSRDDELESDRLGVEYARQAGYDAQAFSEVLEMLKARSAETSKSKELKFLLSTHPKPEERLRGCAEKINSLPSGGERLQERFQKTVISDR